MHTSTYHELCVLSGTLKAGDSLSIAVKSGDGYISFIDDAGNVCLQFDYKDDSGLVSISRATRTGAELAWQSLSRVRVRNETGAVKIGLRVVSDSQVEVSFDAIALDFVDAPVAQATRVNISGDNQGFKLLRADEATAPFDAMVMTDADIDRIPDKFFGEDAIFDVGMHNGDDTDFYLKMGHPVLAIEANPVLARQATIRFQDDIRDGNLVILNMGIHDSPQAISFYVNEVHSEWSSFIEQIASRGFPTRKVLINTVQPVRLLHRARQLCFVKIDIEGCDELFLNALTEVPPGSRPKSISFEMGFHRTEGNVEKLLEAGYDQFAIAPQMDHGQRYQGVKFKSRSGLEFQFQFRKGTSGPFGSQLQAEWVDARSAIARSNSLIAAEVAKRTGIYGEWFDIHARHGA